MKLKKLAAALALAAAGAPAFAAIDTSNNSELFAVVWDETVGSYTMDLGISLNTFLANASTAGYGFSAAVGGAFAQYTAADTNLADGTATSGTRWALFAVDSESFGDPTDTRYLTTANGAGVPPTVTNGTLNTIVPQLATFAADASQTGTHGVAVANNGNSFNPSGSLGTFVESTYFGNPALGLNAGNLLGVLLRQHQLRPRRSRQPRSFRRHRQLQRQHLLVHRGGDSGAGWHCADAGRHVGARLRRSSCEPRLSSTEQSLVCVTRAGVRAEARCAPA